MKQILQHLRTGQTELADVPCPILRPGHLLIQTTRSLISAGTERMLVEFSRGSLLAKARAQPERVKQVLQKIKTDGLMPTLETVFSKLDEPLPLGYCNVGRVVEIGAGVEGFQPGDRVVSNGPHAEIVTVPATLATKIPAHVSDDFASFTVLGSIALHGVRLLEPTFGETFVVSGLGLLGLLGVQFLRASGCHVLGLDPNPARCELAQQFGAETLALASGADPVQAAMAFSKGRGVDGVLVTASAKTDEIMHQAAEMCRKRGRIVLVGVVGLNLRRADFYQKELRFQVSCSYGPGRYDPSYEELARDYPLPYVRWTEGRNFEAVLDGIAQRWVDVEPMISRRVPIAAAASVYDAVVDDPNVLGVVLTYPDQPPPVSRSVAVRRAWRLPGRADAPRVAVIGAGNFTKVGLLPALKAAGADIAAIASAGGVSSVSSGRRFDAFEAATDYRELLRRDDINTFFITTRHNSHARMVCEALAAGKHVFVEKPLAIDQQGLDAVREAASKHPDRHLMVGFNRRFAPHSVALKRALQHRGQPMTVQISMNAGYIPSDSWVHDPQVGGGRIIGEGCHLIDLAMYFVGHAITSVYAVMMGDQAGHLREDKMTIALSFADGSIANINYWANGGKSYPKERVEVFSEGRIAVIDNWQTLRSYDWKHGPHLRTGLDKGHRNEVAQFLGFLQSVERGGAPLIPFEELELVTVASFAAIASARDGNPRKIRLVD